MTPTNTQIWSELVQLRASVQEFLQLKIEVEEMVKTREEANKLGLTIQDFLDMRTDVAHIRSDQLTGQNALQELRKEALANRTERKGEIGQLTTIVEGLEKRMNVYETQANENNQLLKDIKPAVFFIKNSMRLLRWSVGLVGAGVLYQVGTYLFHLLHP